VKGLWSNCQDGRSLPNPFDRALELHELDLAGEEYASRHGKPGSTAYRAARLRFRERVTSVQDLRRIRARRSAPGKPPPLDLGSTDKPRGTA
jgi:hypothetical protein